VPQGSSLPARHVQNVQRNYYVDDVLGSDATTEATARDNPAAPWKTIQKAVDDYLNPASGDVAINVRSGLYQGASGTAQTVLVDLTPASTSQWLIVRNDAGHAPLIRVPAGTGTQKDGVHVRDPFVIVKGFEVDSTGRPGSTPADGTGVWVEASPVELDGLHIHDIQLAAHASAKAQGVFCDVAGNQFWNLRIHDIGAPTAGEAADRLEHGMYLNKNDMWVVNTLVYDIENGFCIQSYNGGATLDLHRLVHCTLAFETDATGLYVYDPRSSTNMIVRNSVFYSAASGVFCIHGGGGGAGAGKEIDHCLEKGAPGGDVEFPGDFTITNNQTDTDPLFADPTGRDFRLLIGSPARGYAESAWSPATDLVGEPRPSGAEDAGAYQFAALRARPRPPLFSGGRR